VKILVTNTGTGNKQISAATLNCWKR